MAHAASSMIAISRARGAARDGADIRGYPGLVHQDHRPGGRAQRGLDAVHRQVLGTHIDVGEHRGGADVAGGVGGGDERQGGHDDLVAGAHPGQDQGEVQSGRARRHRDGLGAADDAGERSFELGHPWALGHPTRRHRLGRRLRLLGAQPRLHHRDHRVLLPAGQVGSNLTRRHRPVAYRTLRSAHRSSGRDDVSSELTRSKALTIGDARRLDGPYSGTQMWLNDHVMSDVSRPWLPRGSVMGGCRVPDVYEATHCVFKTAVSRRKR